MIDSFAAAPDVGAVLSRSRYPRSVAWQNADGARITAGARAGSGER
jgi:hypothetical protein